MDYINVNVFVHVPECSRMLIENQTVSEFKVELIGKLPPFYDVAEFLWGKDVDIDSDGNSEHPNSTDWNELTIILRSDESQRVDIDPAEDGYLNVSSENKELLARVASYLRGYGAIK